MLGRHPVFDKQVAETRGSRMTGRRRLTRALEGHEELLAYFPVNGAQTSSSRPPVATNPPKSVSPFAKRTIQK